MSDQLQDYRQSDGEFLLECTTADHSRKFVADPVSSHAASSWNQKNKAKTISDPIMTKVYVPLPDEATK